MDAIGFGLKAVSLIAGSAIAATLVTHYVPPSPRHDIAAQVGYYARGIGRVGQNVHWLTEASENTTQWNQAVKFCQGHKAQGCRPVRELADAGY